MGARDKFGDVTDETERLAKDGNEEKSEGRIVGPFDKSVFHICRQVEDGGLHDEVVYVDLGADPLENIETSCRRV